MTMVSRSRTDYRGGRTVDGDDTKGSHAQCKQYHVVFDWRQLIRVESLLIKFNQNLLSRIYFHVVKLTVVDKRLTLHSESTVVTVLSVNKGRKE